jgi:hypothetical protein
MRLIEYPHFNRGRVLKNAMLESLRDFPRKAMDVWTEKLSDGIVMGFTPLVERDVITLSEGIVQHRDRLFVSGESGRLAYSAPESERSIKLKFLETGSDPDFDQQRVEIALDEDKTLLENQIELGRFKLKEGAYLRSDYKDLYDFATEYNTINLVHVLYAGYGEPTICGDILKYFAKAAVAARARNPLDVTFAMLCLNQARVERQTLYTYIANKTEGDVRPMTNAQIHRELVRILEAIKKESPPPRSAGAVRRKVVVD